MNYRFLGLSRFLAISIFLCFGPALSAQISATALPDSLPRPDSLSASETYTLAARLAGQAGIFEATLAQQSALALATRETAEQNWKTAKQDTLTPKATLDSLAGVLKTAKNMEKAAQKNQKQASQAASFAQKVVGMDSLNQRKNIRKAWKQVQEVNALLNPPREKPIADVLKAPVGNTPSPDSGAIAEKPKIKEEKPEKAALKYKPRDPATDVMLRPPQRPCTLAVQTRDEFSGQTYRETGREELFRYTNEVMKKVLPPGQAHIVCEAALSGSGANTQLLLTIVIRDAGARKAFGSLTKNSIVSLKFLDGDTFTLTNLRNDDGVRDESGQVFTYRGQYALDAAVLKKLRKTELDKIRIAWGTGYEDYEVQGIDVLMREVKCLGE